MKTTERNKEKIRPFLSRSLINLIYRRDKLAHFLISGYFYRNCLLHAEKLKAFFIHFTSCLPLQTFFCLFWFMLCFLTCSLSFFYVWLFCFVNVNTPKRKKNPSFVQIYLAIKSFLTHSCHSYGLI